MRRIFGFFLVVFFGLSSPMSSAKEQPTSGTYMAEGSGFETGGRLNEASDAITIKLDGEILIANYPQKNTIYILQLDGSFHAYDKNTEMTYMIRAIDGSNIELFDPYDNAFMAKRFWLISKNKKDEVQISDEQKEKWGKIADKYLVVGLNDGVENSAKWSACYSNAKAHMEMSGAELNENTRQMIEKLNKIGLKKSPFPDVINF